MQNIIRIDLEGVNCYLLENNQKFILVDTGGHMFMDKQYTDRRKELVRELEKNGVNNSNLSMIILTHGDNDHVCNASYIRDKFHSKIAMHSGDVFMVEKPEPNCYRVNSKYQSFLLNIVFKLLDSKIKLLMEKVYKEFEIFKPDILLEDNQTLLDFDGRIIHIPGHTPGSICILDDKGNLIAGDIFTNIKKPSLGINAQNFDEMKESARKILRNNTLKIYPGHGEPFDAVRIRV